MILFTGDTNPENLNKETPLKLAVSHGHLIISKFLKKILSLQKGKENFDLNTVLFNEDQPFEGNLHGIMYLNDCEALQKFLLSKNSDQILTEICKEICSGWNPLIIAAEFMSRESLLILLQYISKFVYGSKEEKKKCFKILHCQGKSLLTFIMDSEYFTSELQREAIECEGYLHNWKSAEFQKCLFNHVGTNEMSLKFQELFSEKNALEKGRSKIKIFSIYFTVSILALYKSGSASFDIGSDAAVLAKYHSSNIDESIVSNCTRLEDLEETNQSWTISSDHCFWLQLVPMLIPCLLNLIEVGSFIKRNQAQANGFLKLFMIVLSPLWIVTTALGQAMEEVKKKTNIKKSSDVEDCNQSVFQEAFLSAKMIEVCGEASLQPILQLYLFFLTYVCSGFDNMTTSCISLWTIVQTLSFISSLLSIPRIFTTNYALNKNGMMSSEAKIVYFLYVLLGAIGRILLFELMAFSLGPGNFPYVYMAIGIHIVIMIAVNLTCSSSKHKIDQYQDNCCWGKIVFAKDQLIMGMSNIYIPWSDGKREEEDVKRQLIAELMFFLEYVGISIWGTIQFLPIHLRTKVLGVIWIFYLLSLCFKMAFFWSFHPWKDLIKNEIKSSFKNCTNCSNICRKKECLESEDLLDGVKGIFSSLKSYRYE